jgi:hypothetical protein
MRRLTVVLLGSALLLTSACQRGERPGSDATDETGRTFSSVVYTADPNVASQLLEGFHQVEQNAWRWTARRFLVALHPPSGSSGAGGVLELKFSLPEPLIDRTGGVTIQARVGATPLAPQTYTSAGDHIFRQDVPAAALKGDAVVVEFTLDKFLHAGALDQRELGIVTASVALSSK